MKPFHILVTVLSALAVISLVAGCGEYHASDEPALISAAKDVIAVSRASNSQDTQCSDYVRNVLLRMRINVPAFQANDFDDIMAKYLPTWTMTEFDAVDLNEGRLQLRSYLNSHPDHTAFLAQWPRSGESGHVAVIYKITQDQFEIFQAQAGQSTPNSKPVKVEGLLYGRNGVQRSRLRLWVETLAL